jgi:methionyl-tRNA formyltransferase
MKILLLTKSTPWCHLVQEVLRKSEHDVTVVEGITFKGKAATMAQGPDARNWEQGWTGDLIISYLFPHILSADTLSRAPRAINFHPAPPWHPGFAPYSWAIYKADLEDEGPSSYGYTVHQMDPVVDSGFIYTWDSLPIRYDDTVYRLQQRTMVRLFAEFVKFVERGFRIPITVNAKWGRAKTKADFEELRRLRSDLPSWDIEARIRACRYPGQPGAYFEGEE